MGCLLKQAVLGMTNLLLLLLLLLLLMQLLLLQLLCNEVPLQTLTHGLSYWVLSLCHVQLLPPIAL